MVGEINREDHQCGTLKQMEILWMNAGGSRGSKAEAAATAAAAAATALLLWRALRQL